jgi:hypothetical protein
VTITSIAPRAGSLHADVINGLANAQAFLETHPDLPLNRYGNPLAVSVREGSDHANRAEVDRIAGILGVTATDPHGDGEHYAAVRHFGGGITYRATAISRRAMDGFYAWESYRSSVQAGGKAA